MMIMLIVEHKDHRDRVIVLHYGSMRHMALDDQQRREYTEGRVCHLVYTEPQLPVPVMSEREKTLENALTEIIGRADNIRRLPAADGVRDGLKQAWGDAQKIALKAIGTHTK